jgi:hypothetical protein
MESKNENFMPHIDLFPRLAAVGRFLGRVMMAPNAPFASHGDHFNHPLDTPVAPVTNADFPGTIEYWRGHHQPDEIFDPVQLRFVLNRTEADLGWDDMGNYYQPEPPKAA